jgi:hypothetical protein
LKAKALVTRIFLAWVTKSIEFCVTAASKWLSVQGHKSGLLGTDSGVCKWPIRLASNAKCSGKTAREYGHMRHLHGVQTNRLLIARTIDHSLQDEMASDCSAKAS